MEMTKGIFKQLVGLYVNQVVLNKYELSDEEQKNVREKNKQFANVLDKLKVSWELQNQVAHAGRQSENWNRYTRDVVREVIKKYNH